MKLLERGVYLPHVLDQDGYYFLNVVSSENRVIHRHRLFNLDEADARTALLKRWLDRIDPVRTTEAA